MKALKQLTKHKILYIIKINIKNQPGFFFFFLKCEFKMPESGTYSLLNLLMALVFWNV